MSKISIMIEVTREQQVDIEETCINEGISQSEYFKRLMEGYKSNSQIAINSTESEEIHTKKKKIGK